MTRICRTELKPTGLSLPFPPLSAQPILSQRHSLNPARGLHERLSCPIGVWGLGQSPGCQQFWDILNLKESIWKQAKEDKLRMHKQSVEADDFWQKNFQTFKVKMQYRMSCTRFDAAYNAKWAELYVSENWVGSVSVFAKLNHPSFSNITVQCCQFSAEAAG